MYSYSIVTPTEEIDIGGLSLAALDVSSQQVDWQDGYPEYWNYYESARSDPEYMDVREGILVWPEDQSKIERLYEICEGPMMNYRYELPESWGGSYRPFGSVEEAAAQLYDLPLCIAHFPDEAPEWFLALTGGGMDLRWEICEAYMRLGHLPPVAFADLPQMASRGESAQDQAIIRACKRSFESQSARASDGADNLDRKFS